MLAGMAVLLYRAAVVPSPPWRTAWISTLAILPIPFVAYVVHRTTPELSAGAAAANSVLWGLLAVLLSTIVSYVTFRLRNSVARARRLGQYTLKEKIGEGGMGIVYRAEHEMLRRPTAIKLLPPSKAGEESLRRFEREVQLTARLTNPHTVSIYDFGRTPDGVFYYVMEYLDGVDLETLVQESGPLAPGRAVRILRQVCAALAEGTASADPSDIKPANVISLRARGIPTSRRSWTSAWSDVSTTRAHERKRCRARPSTWPPRRSATPEHGPAQPAARPARGSIPAHRASQMPPRTAQYRCDPPPSADRARAALAPARTRGARGPGSTHPALPRQGRRPAPREREGARQGAGGLRRRAALGRSQRTGLLARTVAEEERGQDGVSGPAAGGPR